MHKILVGVLMIVWFASTAHSQTSNEYVVVLKDGHSASSFFADKTTLEILGTSIKLLNFNDAVPLVDEPYLLLNSVPQTGSTVVLMANDKAVNLLRQHPLIKTVLRNVVLRPLLDTSVPLLGVPQVWSAGNGGAGQAIAILDTGVDSKHPFLSGRIAAEACFSVTDSQKKLLSACPNHAAEMIGVGAAGPSTAAKASGYHGTHVAGIAAGANGIVKMGAINGVAKAATIVPIQIFHFGTDVFKDCFPSPSPCLLSDTESMVRGLLYVKQIAKLQHISVVNMSLGTANSFSTCDDNPDFSGLKIIVDELKAMEVAVVASAGNGSKISELSFPACITNTISVGASDDGDNPASFSDSSEGLDFYAPGVAIVSSVPGGGFIFEKGTSMAAPHVAGAIALLKEAFPRTAVDDIVKALRETGKIVRDPRNGLKRPRIDVDRAFKLLAGQN